MVRVERGRAGHLSVEPSRSRQPRGPPDATGRTGTTGGERRPVLTVPAGVASEVSGPGTESVREGFYSVTA
jgi:hypothetical protein